MIHTVYYHIGRVRGPGARANTHNSTFGPFGTREEAELHKSDREETHRGSPRHWGGWIEERLLDDSWQD